MFERYTSLVSKTIFDSISDAEVHTSLLWQCDWSLAGHIA